MMRGGTSRLSGRVRRSLAVGGGILLMVVVAVPATASGSAPFDLSAAGDYGNDPQVALDGPGNATFVWRSYRDGNVMQTRQRSAAGALGPLRSLPRRRAPPLRSSPA